MIYVLISAAAIGFVAGLRSLTAPAAVSWGAYLGWLDLQGSPLAFMGSAAAVAILSVLAMAEYVADKLPRTPSRIKPGPLTGRMLMGALTGAALAISGYEWFLTGMLLGAAGAVAGAFAGYQARTRLVKATGFDDWVFAVSEDLAALGLAFFIVSQL